MNRQGQSLVNQLMGLLPAPSLVSSLLVAGVLLLPLLLAGLDPDIHPTVGFAPQALWRLAMAPTLIVFILAVHPLLQSRWRLAVEQLRPLSRQPELIDQAFVPNRLGEALALLLGTAMAVWISESSLRAGWLAMYGLAMNILMFGLLALSIHEGLRRTRHLKRVVAAGLALDLFDRQLLTPLARFGQSLSLTFVGGTCLSLIFQSASSLYSLQSLVIYTVTILVALSLFFSSIWSIHAALVVAQERELALVRAHWQRARDTLRRQLAPEGAAGEQGILGTDEALKLYEPLAAFGAFERQVLEASTWPFNPKIVKELAASLIAPVLIYGLKLALGLSGTV